MPAKTSTPGLLDALESDTAGAEEPKGPLGSRPRRVVFVIAAALFLGESIVIAAAYAKGLSAGFSLVIGTNAFGSFWPELVLVAVSVALSVYVLCVVEGRLQSALVDHWEANDARAGPSTQREPGSRSAWSWAREGGLTLSSILFFAEAMTLMLVLIGSYLGGFSIAVSLNNYGEFWIEFPLVLAAVPLSLYAIGLSTNELRTSFARHSEVDAFTPEPRPRRWLLPSATRLVPASLWVPGSPATVRLRTPRSIARGTGGRMARFMGLGGIGGRS